MSLTCRDTDSPFSLRHLTGTRLLLKWVHELETLSLLPNLRYQVDRFIAPGCFTKPLPERRVFLRSCSSPFLHRLGPARGRSLIPGFADCIKRHRSQPSASFGESKNMFVDPFVQLNGSDYAASRAFRRFAFSCGEKTGAHFIETELATSALGKDWPCFANKRYPCARLDYERSSA